MDILVFALIAALVAGFALSALFTTGFVLSQAIAALRGPAAPAPSAQAHV